MNLLLQPHDNPPKMQDKSAIWLAARRHVGTPFRHQGRGAHGLDCLGLLIRVARDLNLSDRTGRPLAEGDTRDYGWRPDGAAFHAALSRCLTSKSMLEAGDIALFRLQGNPQHVGLLSQLADGRLGLIHAYAPAGRVVEHGFDGPWPKRLQAVFSL